jgi:hypothetical protein
MIEDSICKGQKVAEKIKEEANRKWISTRWKENVTIIFKGLSPRIILFYNYTVPIKLHIPVLSFILSPAEYQECDVPHSRNNISIEN